MRQRPRNGLPGKNPGQGLRPGGHVVSIQVWGDNKGTKGRQAVDEQTCKMYLKAVVKAMACGAWDEVEMWLGVIETSYGPEAMADIAVAAYSCLALEA